jgi:hypothetical protein
MSTETAATRLGVTATSRPVDRNPLMDGDMNHWRVTLRYEGRRMVVTFSMGLALEGPPSADQVLEALLLDASGIESARDFADWCSEYGYDTDSRKAERIYKACQRQAERLRYLLSDDYDHAVFPRA